MNLTGGGFPEQLRAGAGDRRLLPPVRRADRPRPNVHRRRGPAQRRQGRGPQPRLLDSGGSAAIRSIVGKTHLARRRPVRRRRRVGSVVRHLRVRPAARRVDCRSSWNPPAPTRAHYFTAAARLKPGVTLAQAQDADAGCRRTQFRASSRTRSAARHSFGVAAAAGAHGPRTCRPSLLVLVGAVSFVLLSPAPTSRTCCWCARRARKREIAIRAAMGAGRGRIVRQLLTESVLLSLAGGALGLVLGMHRHSRAAGREHRRTCRASARTAPASPPTGASWRSRSRCRW